MSINKQLEKIGIGLIIVAAVFFICDVLEVDFLKSITRYGSHLFTLGAVFWISGYATRKKVEKNKN